MPISEAALQRVLAILADEDQLKVTVRASGYGGVVAGVTTTIGGLIAGPAGLLVGGALGGLLAYANAGDFKPVSQVVKEMNAHERQLLYNATRDIVDNLGIDDYLLDGAQVCVFNEVSFAGFLKSHHSRALETKVGLEILSDFTHKTLEGQLADQETDTGFTELFEPE